MGRVVLNEVTKKYGDVLAVDRLSLEVTDGEFLVLLGPSGCGKSTALRMIAGLEAITGGTITLGDTVVNDVEPKNRDVAMVFQSYALYPHMTVAQNIEFPLKNRKVDAAERKRQVAEAARSLGLTDYLDRKPAKLSGGQRQRVALARAIVRRPQVFLMDEPLSNLDATLRVQTRAELADLHRRLCVTTVYVTHDQVEAMTLGERVAILSAGVLQQVGTPAEVYARPANVFVAEFIGSPPMAVLPVVVSAGQARFAGGGSWPAPLGAHDGAAGVGVRPEALRLIDSGGLAARVLNVEELGHERHILCDPTGAGPDAAGKQVIVRQSTSAGGVVPSIGAEVHIGADPAHVHLFDAVTGARIDDGAEPAGGSDGAS